MIKQRTLIVIITMGILLWGLARLPWPYIQEKKIHPFNVVDQNHQFIENNVTPPDQPKQKIDSLLPRINDEIVNIAEGPLISQTKTKKYLAPFTAQAPFGEWQDPRQQDGCEEASLVMAWHWLEGTSFTKSQALEEILALSKFEEKTIGEWRSTNAADTAKIFKEYYHYDNLQVRYDISVDDIKTALAEGNLVLAPTDGRKLGNPYYKQPGPPEHMLVIFDYDKKTDEFVTNDPGTRRGQNYRYKSAVVMEAIVDYPTGHREPNPNPQTAMIVISPKE